MAVTEVKNINNEKTGEVKNYKAGPGENDLRSNDVWAITVSKNNKIWIGTLGKGIARFDLKNGKFYNYYSQSTVGHDA